MIGITLSAATRSNLLALQNVAENQTRTQTVLSTGKRVNSALDNPVNYFTSAKLADRSGDISGLLDGLMNGVQTLQAASHGIDAIQKLVQMGQSIVSRASIAPNAVEAPASASSSGDYTSDDIVGAQRASLSSIADASISSTTGAFIYSINNGPPITFTYHDPASPAAGTFKDINSLRDAINAKVEPGALQASSSSNGKRLYLFAADKNDTFEISGPGASAIGFGASNSKATPSPSLDTKTVTYTVGKGVEQRSVAVPYGYDAGQVTTLDQLNSLLSTADMVATIEPSPSGKVVVRSIAGREADTIVLTAPDTEPSPTGVKRLTGQDSPFPALAALSEPGASQRKKLANDYAEILKQITGLAQDSGYNGQNLLMGATMRLSFNESGANYTEVQGDKMDAEGLGLLTSLDGDFLDKKSVQAATSQLQTATDKLRVKSSEFVMANSVVQTRQDFSKSLIHILDTGSNNLTEADMNDAAASTTALDVRRQLATSALGLANQAQQSILQLLRG